MPNYEDWRGKYESGDMSLRQIAEIGQWGLGTVRKHAQRAKPPWIDPKKISSIPETDITKTLNNGFETSEILGQKLEQGDKNVKKERAIDRIKNPRRRRFAQLVPVSNSPREAAEAAGFQGKYVNSVASRLIKDSQIAAAIKETQEEIADRMGWTMERMYTEWDDLRQKCSEGVPIYDKFGNLIGASLFNSKAVVASLENIGKLAGRYVEKRDVSLTGKLVVFAGENDLVD